MISATHGGPAVALAFVLSITAGCITNSAGPSTVDVYNGGSQVVKVHVLFNTTAGRLVEQQIFIVGPANVDEKNVRATNVTETVLMDAFTEGGLHLAKPIRVMLNGASIDVNVTDSTVTATSHASSSPR